MRVLKGTAPGGVCSLLYGSHAGTVAMVNSRGIYLELSGRHILLCDEQYGTVPNGVCAENWEGLPCLLKPGQPIRTEDGILHISGQKLLLQLRQIPKDCICRLPPEHGPEQALKLLQQLPEKGLAPLAKPLFGKPQPQMELRCVWVFDAVQQLIKALEENENIEAPVKALLGFGQGLTPSGDDILAGLMFGLRHSPLRDSEAAKALTEAVQRNARERTNAISADYLLAVSWDEPFSRLSDAWRDPAQSAEALLAIGSSSGSEMLLGLLLAARVLGQL